PFTVSSRSISLIEKVAEGAGGRLWLQLKVTPGRAKLDGLFDRAKAAGYEALMVNIGPMITPNDEGGRLQYNALDIARHPRWLFSVLTPGLLNGTLHRSNGSSPERRLLSDGESGTASSVLTRDALTWEGLRELRKH